MSDSIIRTLATKHGLRIIGDAAQAHGAAYHGTPIAKLADITCFSFYPGKNLGALGDGGLVLSDDEEVLERVRHTRDHGRRCHGDTPP